MKRSPTFAAPLLSALFLAAPAPAQLDAWEVTAPGNGALWSALEAPGGDLFVSGEGFVARLDAAGTSVWALDPLAHVLDHDLAPDGSVFVGGQLGEWPGQPRAWIAKYDGDGQLLWSRRFEHFAFSDAGFTTVLATADGGVVAGGWWQDDECTSAWLVARFDAGGTQLWSRSTAFFSAPSDMVELADGSVVVAGSWGRVARISATGNVLWTVVYDDEHPWMHPWLDLTPSGDVVMSGGWHTVDHPQAWYGVERRWSNAIAFNVKRFEPDGTLVWSRDYSSGEAEYATGICATPDDGCVVVGESAVLGGSDLRVMKIDAAGEVDWSRVYGGPEITRVEDVARAANGDLLVVARREVAPGQWRGALLRLDSSGGLGSCAPLDAVFLPEADAPSGVRFGMANQSDFFESYVVNAPATTVTVASFCPSLALGSNDCGPAVLNSTGLSGVIGAKGSDQVAQNDLRLLAAQMPANQVGYFLAGMGAGQVQPPGSQGVLCLAGATIHRYAKLVSGTGSGGAFGLAVDLTAIPGHGAVMSGETWRFQAWFRDKNPGTTSNFTDAVGVLFQ